MKSLPVTLDPNAVEIHRPLNCTGSSVERGTATLSGTGRYADLRGQGKWVNRGTLVAPWSPTWTLDDVTNAYVVFSFTGSASLG
jgi:hypothetical protein